MSLRQQLVRSKLLTPEPELKQPAFITKLHGLSCKRFGGEWESEDEPMRRAEDAEPVKGGCKV